jgi:hypothetical protein
MSVHGSRIQVPLNRLIQKYTGIFGAQASVAAPYGSPSGTQASPHLVGLVLGAANRTGGTADSVLSERCVSIEQRCWAQTWPGEHYRFLSALGAELGGGVAVEIRPARAKAR